MKSFIESQFGYCPLIWMFHSRGLNNKIIHLHEPSLGIVYHGNVHQRTIQSLAIELLKVKGNLSSTIMNDMLQTRTLTYNFRLQTDFARSFVNTSRFGLNFCLKSVEHSTVGY